MAAHQAPPSLGFSRREHWSGLPFPSPMHESEKWKWSRSVVSSNPMDCSAPGSSVHGSFQARVLEWGAIAFSLSLSRACLSLQHHTFIPTSHLLRPLLKWHWTSPSSSNLCSAFPPSICICFFLLPGMLISLSFTWLTPIIVLSSLTKSFWIFWPHLVPCCTLSLSPHP